MVVVVGMVAGGDGGDGKTGCGNRDGASILLVMVVVLIVMEMVMMVVMMVVVRDGSCINHFSFSGLPCI